MIAPTPEQQAMAEAMAAHYAENEYREAIREKLQRSREALRLYEPLPYQEQFHKCRAKQVIIQKGNRTGGTLANMVEIARAVTGQDPYNKYPKKDGRAVVLGYGEGHIGRVFHKMLFRPGAFQVIRDEVTRRWRTYRHWPQDEGGDAHRAAEKMPAPPLIHQRFIDGKISWVKKGDYVFSLVKFINGWELHAFNSSGDSANAQGFDANLYAIDEDLALSDWYEEAVGRIAACNGVIRWSALPHAKNNALMELLQQAEEEAGTKEPEAVVIRASILDNPYQDRASREKSMTAWKRQGDDVYRKRVMGEIVLDSVMMYPTYNRRIHSVIRDKDTPQTEVQRILTERQGEPPNDWTKFMIVDPGHTTCAVLFCATPPPEIGDQRVVYQEAYLTESTAAVFGQALDLYAVDKVFEKFIIDMHGASIAAASDGLRTLEYYVAELKDRRLKCEQTGSYFSPACDMVKFREEALRNWLALQRNGQPTILIVNERCPNLVREMERFRKKTIKQGNKDIPLDEGNRRANTHAVECLEYFAADGGDYVKPRQHAITPSWVDQVLAQDAKNARRYSGVPSSKSINLGPRGVPVR